MLLRAQALESDCPGSDPSSSYYQLKKKKWLKSLSFLIGKVEIQSLNIIKFLPCARHNSSEGVNTPAINRSRYYSKNMKLTNILKLYLDFCFREDGVDILFPVAK